MIRILYIDGSRERFDRINRQVEERYEDLSLAWAGSAVPAQMILERGGYDCVVASYMLSDLDGLTLLQRLRQNGNSVPFILLIGQPNKQLREKAMKSGANAVLEKADVENDAALLDAAIREAMTRQDDHQESEEEIEALRRQAAFFQIDPAPVLQAQYSGMIVNHNIAAREIFAQKLKGKQLTELFNGLNLYDIKIIANYGVSQLEQKIGDETFLFTFRSDVDSKLLYVFGSNITDRILAENELRRAHGENALLLTSITNILISVDRNGSIRQWNKAAEEIFGISSDAAIGTPFAKCGINWREGTVVERLPELLRISEPVRLESVRFTLPGGSDSFLSITISPIRVRAGKNSGFLFLADDITERKVLEDQLSQAQKLEAIGQLAAGIAHEINTPTQYISDNTHFINDAFKDITTVTRKLQELVAAHKAGQPVEKLIQELERAADDADLGYLVEEIPTAIDQSLEGINRVTNIVRAMKEFSHPGTEEKTAIDIAKALQSTITVARNVWKYVADVETTFDPELPPVHCYPGELNQVFLNIITNAAHAISDVVGDGTSGKGKITVTTAKKGNWAVATIGDTGSGIPEKIQKRIFEPFFTTKDVGKGTGQGLAISHSVIVDKHGGLLSFETEAGKGTKFIIKLPLQENETKD